MSAETVSQSLSSKHQASTWSKLLAVREFGSFAALIIMILVIAIFIPQFSNWENIVNITRNFAFVGIVALGMTLVILTGGIDLSVGSVWGMTAVITASLMSSGWSMAPAILVGLLAAAAVGVFNGLCITRLNMSPFVPTLASLAIARSLALIITHGRPISDFGPQKEAFYWIGGGSLKEATEGKKIESVDTGVAVVDASNVDQFIKK
jgi:ribose transport system permease protein